MTPRRRAWKNILGMGAAAMLVVLGACREEDVLLPSADNAAQATGADDGTWLEVLDGETPVAFMARLTGEAPADLAPPLARAEQRYRESPRMIVNRVVQLWQEIAARDAAAVTAVTLLESLAPGDQAGRDHSLGTVIQHYRVSRLQGLGHEQALEAALRAQQSP